MVRKPSWECCVLTLFHLQESPPRPRPAVSWESHSSLEPRQLLPEVAMCASRCLSQMPLPKRSPPKSASLVRCAHWSGLWALGVSQSFSVISVVPWCCAHVKPSLAAHFSLGPHNSTAEGGSILPVVPGKNLRQ